MVPPSPIGLPRKWRQFLKPSLARGEESQSKESHVEETNDLDYPAPNRKNRDSRLEASSMPPTCKQYPRLREALAVYMMTGPEDEKVYPKPRHVVDVMDAGAGATEEEVLRCLSYLWDERGLRPGPRAARGTSRGSRRWFVNTSAAAINNWRLNQSVPRICPLAKHNMIP